MSTMQEANTEQGGRAKVHKQSSDDNTVAAKTLHAHLLKRKDASIILWHYSEKANEADKKDGR